MSWSKPDGRRPLIIAHRGDSAHAVENTTSAFEAARVAGADGVELDVQRCASGEVVVFHDDDLVRLAGRPERVCDLTMPELRRVRLAGGERIPTLAEALEAIGSSLLVNVELKANPTLRLPPGLVPATLAVIADAGAVDRVLVSSFHPAAVFEVRVRASALPTGYLFHGGQALPFRAAWPARMLRPFALHPERRLVSPRTMRRWRRAGYRVNAWTVDKPVEIARLVRRGVDALITNDSAATRAQVERARRMT